jgi:hypothetical protein
LVLRERGGTTKTLQRCGFSERMGDSPDARVRGRAYGVNTSAPRQLWREPIMDISQILHALIAAIVGNLPILPPIGA